MRIGYVLFASLVTVMMILGPSVMVFGQMGGGKTCEQCGMTVDATSEAHFRIVDSSGTVHYAECMMCALKLLKTYGQLNITTSCDYFGSNYSITVNAKAYGSSVVVSPTNALVIAGGGCAKNRVVYNQTAASSLLANNGTSDYLAAIQKYVNGVDGTLVTVPINSTIMTVAQAALQFGGGTPSSTPTGTLTPANYLCEQCKMDVPADAQMHFKIVDGTGKAHYACCLKCAIKLTSKVDSLNITTNCDWFGPNFPITISINDNLGNITVNPSTALLVDGGCANNRVVYDQTAANAILANNGRSKYLIASQNTVIPSNATVMSIAEAVVKYGTASGVSPTASPAPSVSPSPTPSPVPTTTSSPSSSPTSQPSASPLPAASATPTGLQTQTCEACGMDVSPESQTRYVVTDGNGNIHYVECFMCALSLINDYPTLHVQTYCDWYGPNYTINVDSTAYGNTVTISPSTAMFLRGGSCVTARAAYNQTAADNLLASGFSQYTSPEQQYPLPSGTNVKLVGDAIKTWYLQPKATGTPMVLVLALAGVAGALIIGLSVLAYRRLKSTEG